MAVVTELFRSEDNGTLSFGDYTLAQKAKKGDIQFEGDIYKIKTFKTMTKLDKNGQLIFESVPGSAVHNFVATTGLKRPERHCNIRFLSRWKWQRPFRQARGPRLTVKSCSLRWRT